jgi:hypothetical protein
MSCPECNWSGVTSDTYELFNELPELRCPMCDKKLGPLHLYPTIDEIRAAAADGNPRAIAELGSAEQLEKRWRRAETLELRNPDQLPEVPGSNSLFATWSLQREPDDHYVVLRVGEQELARELAIWEGLPRFEAIAELLRERYGRRITELRPDEGEAVTYLSLATSSPGSTASRRRTRGCSQRPRTRGRSGRCRIGIRMDCRR